MHNFFPNAQIFCMSGIDVSNRNCSSGYQRDTGSIRPGNRSTIHSACIREPPGKCFREDGDYGTNFRGAFPCRTQNSVCNENPWLLCFENFLGKIQDR